MRTIHLLLSLCLGAILVARILIGGNSKLQSFVVDLETSKPSIASPLSPGTILHDAPFNFSACLLVKDDNKILPEWLAYHYEFLPLRHLVLAVDPWSLTSPEYIAGQFRDKLGMEITIWHDKDYIFDVHPDFNVYGNSTVEERFNAHFYRQTAFMTMCTRHHATHNRSFVILPDSDEYLAFNHYRENEEPDYCIHKYRGTTAKRLDNASRAECNAKFRRRIDAGEIPRKTLPKMGSGVTVAHYIDSQRDEIDPWFLRHCILVPRVMFGGKKSPDEIDIPDGFDITNFYSLRFRLHGPFYNSRPGKSIVDVSRYDPFEKRVLIPHAVLGAKECKAGQPMRISESLFRFQHYTGSLAVFTSRPDDVHRNEEVYNYRNNYTVAGESFDIVEWLAAFVQRVGKDRALWLTQGLQEWAFEDNAKVSALFRKDNSSLRELSLMRAGKRNATSMFPYLKEGEA